MSNKLLNLITTNQKALKKILKSKNQEEGFQIATSFIISYEEKNFNHDLVELHQIMDDETLDNDDLDKIVGGADDNGHKSEFRRRVLGVFKRWRDQDKQ